MFRLWGKEFKDNRMLKDLVICDEYGIIGFITNDEIL